MKLTPKTTRATPHPMAGKTMTGAEMVVQILADEGVDTIFGYSGGAILPTYDAVFRYNAEHVDDEGKEPMPLLFLPMSRAQGSWRPVMPLPRVRLVS